MPITFGFYGSLACVTMENVYVRAVILPSKGADILEFTHKKTGVNALYRSDLPISAYDGLDLGKKRLSFHSEKLLGGYMDLLPHRGIYKGQVLEQSEGGIAATLPWEAVVLSDDEMGARLKCQVDLPVFPFRAERIYTLEAESRMLHIEETVKNTGDEAALFTWTQHALFGKGILEGNVEFQIPGQTVFLAWEHLEHPDEPLEEFRSEASHVKLKQGIFDLRKPFGEGVSEYEFVVFKDLREGKVKIVNDDWNLGVSYSWDIAEFPYLRAIYKHGEDGPLTGLEPSNDLFSGWEYSEKYGTYTRLEAGETLKTWFALDFEDRRV